MWEILGTNWILQQGTGKQSKRLFSVLGNWMDNGTAHWRHKIYTPGFKY